MENLLLQVVSNANLRAAYEQVVKNKGAPGVDGVKTEDLSAYLKTHWLRIRSQILEGTYRPLPVRGVKIPKPNGGQRQLGIPTVVDRLIQQAIHQVLSPLYDPEFSAFSYGFRPNRNAHQALFQALEYINEGRQDIVDLDLKSFFDKVHHDKLMGLLRRKIKDKLFLRLIHRYLQCGMTENGTVSRRSQGTPQGGPLSPLLSNILLNELDKELTKRGHCFVRYDDDCSIFLKSKSAAERARTSITRYLEVKLLLEVNEEKTNVCRPVNFTLLGHSFVPTYTKGERGKYRLRIAKKSRARRFAWSRLGGWRIACSPIMGTTVTEDRLRQRGYTPFLEYYLKVKHAKKKS